MISEDVNANNSVSEWERCPKGDFGRLSSSLRTRRSRRVFLRQATVGGIVAIASAGVGLWLWGGGETDSMQEPNYGGITCSETRRVMMGKENLSCEVKEKIRNHLARCRPCRSQLHDRMDRLS